METITEAGAPTEPTLSPEELQKKLEHLKASATQQYSLKNYAAAAEHYSEAAEVQDAINGEMSPENADLLYQYGRCLYHVGVSKSDVLGGKVASSEEPKRKKRKVSSTQAESSKAGAANGGSAVVDALKEGEEKLAEEVVEAVVDEKEGGKMEDKAASNKPFFQITGDENFTDSEDEGDEEEGEGEAEEEDDDFAIAYEILDVARVLLRRKIDSLSSDQADAARAIKERLADTHDLQAEIKLENEQFADAVTDAQECLNLKLELYPQESGMVAEAHYKLAITLDFASLPTAPADEADMPAAQVKEEPKVDEEMRKRAAEEMEKAILSCTLRLQNEEAKLSAETEAGKKDSIKRDVADVKSLISEMKNRLVDLRNPAPAAGLQATGPAGAPDGSDPLRGILGAMLGESKAEQTKRLQEATQQANDLSGMIRKKKVKTEGAGAEAEGKGKRKAEDGGEEANGNGKKVKFEGEA